MEELQTSLTQHGADRQAAMEPAQDSIMRAYASMISPQSGFDPSSLSRLSGTQPANYYDQGQGGNPGSKWWGGTQQVSPNAPALGGAPGDVPYAPQTRAPW